MLERNRKERKKEQKNCNRNKIRTLLETILAYWRRWDFKMRSKQFVEQIFDEQIRKSTLEIFHWQTERRKILIYSKYSRQTSAQRPPLGP